MLGRASRPQMRSTTYHFSAAEVPFRYRPGRSCRIENHDSESAQKLSNPYAHFISGYHRRNEFLAASAQRLSNRQCRRKHDRRWMEHRSVVHVVLFGKMGRCSIASGRNQWTAASPVNQGLAGAIPPAVCVRHVLPRYLSACPVCHLTGM